MPLQFNRLISLDALRGFTIAAMVLVNFPGNHDHVYAPLLHSKWNGLTFTDLIFPIFLFIVGLSIAFAYTKRLQQGLPKKEMYRKIVLRSFKIFAVGIFLNMLPDFDLTELRWTGTLPRIAVVFLACAILFLNTRWKTQAWIGAGILVAYWLAMTLIPTPGVGKVMLDPGINLAAWVDSKYLPGKMWQGTWDPEGILSTIPSIVSGISGLLAGSLLLADFDRNKKVNYLMSLGLLATVAGYFWGLSFPVNESIWTSSFVLVSSGIAAILLGAVYFSVDILGHTKGTKAGVILGANAITVYVLADILSIFFYHLNFGRNKLNGYFEESFVSIGFQPEFVSMLYALLFVGINFIPAYFLYRKNIFIKL